MLNQRRKNDSLLVGNIGPRAKIFIKFISEISVVKVDKTAGGRRRKVSGKKVLSRRRKFIYV